MNNREEYVNTLNKQLENWNAEIAKWQEQARQAQDAQRAEYERQLEIYRKQRDQAMEELRKLQMASGDAWMEMTRGVDEAWARMREAYERAGQKFYK